MIASAYASLYHWMEVGQPINVQRGEWLISHVWANLGKADFALHHARECLAITEREGIGGFDLAFALEAMTRAFGIAGNSDQFNKFRHLAEEAATGIEDEGDRNYFVETLNTCELK